MVHVGAGYRYARLKSETPRRRSRQRCRFVSAPQRRNKRQRKFAEAHQFGVQLIALGVVAADLQGIASVLAPTVCKPVVKKFADTNIDVVGVHEIGTVLFQPEHFAQPVAGEISSGLFAPIIQRPGGCNLLEIVARAGVIPKNHRRQGASTLAVADNRTAALRSEAQPGDILPGGFPHLLLEREQQVVKQRCHLNGRLFALPITAEPDVWCRAGACQSSAGFAVEGAGFHSGAADIDPNVDFVAQLHLQLCCTRTGVSSLVDLNSTLKGLPLGCAVNKTRAAHFDSQHDRGTSALWDQSVSH